MTVTENCPHLYIVFSRTETGMGRLIRAVSRYPYNHVSLSLDPQLRTLVSFARYVWDTPLYGGFVRETPERYLSGSRNARVCVYRVAISPERREALAALFDRAGEETGLIYNTYDALACGMGLSAPLPNAYTCLGFACAVLGLQARNLRELESQLPPEPLYQGELSGLLADSGQRSDPYFAPLGILRGTGRTLHHFADLTGRIFSHQPDILSKYLP